MKKAAIATVALVAEGAAVAYSTHSAMTTLAVMCVQFIPFVFAVALAGHVGTAVVVAFAAWSWSLALMADAQGTEVFPRWLLTVFYKCGVVALVAGGVWIWQRARAGSPARDAEELDIVRYIAGEPD